MSEEQPTQQSTGPGYLKTTIAGGVGGSMLVLVGHPLDTIKVRIQTMTVVPGQAAPYSGTWDCAQKTVRSEGFFALYRGMGAPLAGVTPMYMLCFLGYEVGKHIFCTPQSFTDLKLFEIAAAGATSAIFTTPILAPGERLKCVLQVQKDKTRFKGPIDVFKALYAEGGIRSVSRGFSATLLRDSVASAFYFSSYEYLKRKLTPEGKKGPSPAGTLFAGGMAGIFNWMFAIPIDTLKTRLQIAPEGKYNGIRNVLVDVLRNEGATALFRGIGPVMIRAFPANAACFLGYETTIKVLNWLSGTQ
eukprot:TRINITY_DN365_c0_g1_i1.p1 TRINITY_DN365_c0_g1~~TRINITY_DN365_c0_g1_i1.p1  ORF type:complete len:329 (+),score=91.19 TRINITY_DN365_c0_g1_i1:84-989(+)